MNLSRWITPVDSRGDSYEDRQIEIEASQTRLFFGSHPQLRHVCHLLPELRTSLVSEADDSGAMDSDDVVSGDRFLSVLVDYFDGLATEKGSGQPWPGMEIPLPVLRHLVGVIDTELLGGGAFDAATAPTVLRLLDLCSRSPLNHRPLFENTRVLQAVMAVLRLSCPSDSANQLATRTLRNLVAEELVVIPPQSSALRYPLSPLETCAMLKEVVVPSVLTRRVPVASGVDSLLYFARCSDDEEVYTHEEFIADAPKWFDVAMAGLSVMPTSLVAVSLAHVVFDRLDVPQPTAGSKNNQTASSPTARSGTVLSALVGEGEQLRDVLIRCLIMVDATDDVSDRKENWSSTAYLSSDYSQHFASLAILAKQLIDPLSCYVTALSEVIDVRRDEPPSILEYVVWHQLVSGDGMVNSSSPCVPTLVQLLLQHGSTLQGADGHFFSEYVTGLLGMLKQAAADSTHFEQALVRWLQPVLLVEDLCDEAHKVSVSGCLESIAVQANNSVLQLRTGSHASRSAGSLCRVLFQPRVVVGVARHASPTTADILCKWLTLPDICHIFERQLLDPPGDSCSISSYSTNGSHRRGVSPAKSIVDVSAPGSSAAAQLLLHDHFRKPLVTTCTSAPMLAHLLVAHSKAALATGLVVDLVDALLDGRGGGPDEPDRNLDVRLVNPVLVDALNASAVLYDVADHIGTVSARLDYLRLLGLVAARERGEAIVATGECVELIATDNSELLVMALGVVTRSAWWVTSGLCVPEAVLAVLKYLSPVDILSGGVLEMLASLLNHEVSALGLASAGVLSILVDALSSSAESGTPLSSSLPRVLVGLISHGCSPTDFSHFSHTLEHSTVRRNTQLYWDVVNSVVQQEALDHLQRNSWATGTANSRRGTNVALLSSNGRRSRCGYARILLPRKGFPGMRGFTVSLYVYVHAAASEGGSVPFLRFTGSQFALNLRPQDPTAPSSTQHSLASSAQSASVRVSAGGPGMAGYALEPFSSSYALPGRQWVFITITLDAVSKELQLYADGVAVDNAAWTAGYPHLFGPEYLEIGCGDFHLRQDPSVVLDVILGLNDIGVFGDVFSPSQVDVLYRRHGGAFHFTQVGGAYRAFHRQSAAAAISSCCTPAALCTAALKYCCETGCSAGERTSSWLRFARRCLATYTRLCRLVDHYFPAAVQEPVPSELLELNNAARNLLANAHELIDAACQSLHGSFFYDLSFLAEATPKTASVIVRHVGGRMKAEAETEGSAVLNGTVDTDLFIVSALRDVRRYLGGSDMHVVRCSFYDTLQQMFACPSRSTQVDALLRHISELLDAAPTTDNEKTHPDAVRAAFDGIMLLVALVLDRMNPQSKRHEGTLFEYMASAHRLRVIVRRVYGASTTVYPEGIRKGLLIALLHAFPHCDGPAARSLFEAAFVTYRNSDLKLSTSLMVLLLDAAREGSKKALPCMSVVIQQSRKHDSTEGGEPSKEPVTAGDAAAVLHTLRTVATDTTTNYYRLFNQYYATWDSGTHFIAFCRDSFAVYADARGEADAVAVEIGARLVFDAWPDDCLTAQEGTLNRLPSSLYITLLLDAFYTCCRDDPQLLCTRLLPMLSKVLVMHRRAASNRPNQDGEAMAAQQECEGALSEFVLYVLSNIRAEHFREAAELSYFCACAVSPDNAMAANFVAYALVHAPCCLFASTTVEPAVPHRTAAGALPNSSRASSLETALLRSPPFSPSNDPQTERHVASLQRLAAVVESIVNVEAEEEVRVRESPFAKHRTVINATCIVLQSLFVALDKLQAASPRNALRGKLHSFVTWILRHRHDALTHLVDGAPGQELATAVSSATRSVGYDLDGLAAMHALVTQRAAREERLRRIAEWTDAASTPGSPPPDRCIQLIPVSRLVEATTLSTKIVRSLRTASIPCLGFGTTLRLCYSPPLPLEHSVIFRQPSTLDRILFSHDVIWAFGMFLWEGRLTMFNSGGIDILVVVATQLWSGCEQHSNLPCLATAITASLEARPQPFVVALTQLARVSTERRLRMCRSGLVLHYRGERAAIRLCQASNSHALLPTERDAVAEFCKILADRHPSCPVDDQECRVEALMESRRRWLDRSISTFDYLCAITARSSSCLHPSPFLSPHNCLFVRKAV